MVARNKAFEDPHSVFSIRKFKGRGFGSLLVWPSPFFATGRVFHSPIVLCICFTHLTVQSLQQSSVKQYSKRLVKQQIVSGRQSPDDQRQFSQLNTPCSKRSPKEKITIKLYFCKILRNKYHHPKELPKKLYLNGITIGFHPQTKKLELHTK